MEKLIQITEFDLLGKQSKPTTGSVPKNNRMVR